MSRRKAAPKRHILQDPLFKSRMVTKFINRVMESGGKSKAEKVVYDALNIVANKLNGKAAASADTSIRNDGNLRDLAHDALKRAIDAASPVVEVRTRRVGGSNYQVPVEVRADRRVALAMRWIIQYAKARRGEKTMVKRLAAEILDAIENRGEAVKKRLDTHRMAEANKAYAHFKF